MNKILSFFLLFSLSFVNAQELNCTIKVNADKIGGTNTQVFKTLEKSLNDFVNKTLWTSEDYKPNEKINCSMNININSYESDIYSASIQVQSSRPIYNSTYSSPIFNYNDKDFNFSYTEFQNLTFSSNVFDSNLVSVIAFYCNIIIGLDADTFTPSGGSRYFEIAQEIVNVAQPNGSKGWTQGTNNQNRYHLANDLISNTYSMYRGALYLYHLEGLDIMSKDLKVSKTKIKSALEAIGTIHSTRPNAFLTRIFFDAKADEIVSIFSGGPSIPIVDLVENLNKISPTNSNKWVKIKF